MQNLYSEYERTKWAAHYEVAPLQQLRRADRHRAAGRRDRAG
jgi:hypothetical protein